MGRGTTGEFVRAVCLHLRKHGRFGKSIRYDPGKAKVAATELTPPGGRPSKAWYLPQQAHHFGKREEVDDQKCWVELAKRW